ncbi:UDP-N-acetylmuramoyl-tripeptide--D-alanyl-D-alanine ligase [Palleronia sp. LCG004]|uniref:UDP-N-acetylmuramoyl-tripeptide--D-alanyl-D- alanine ligase n=1 Tax=Palleronia sp. LCG004 TaxID=3079304 RepID=UPI002942C91F|nr:UDP-N-acetylmuramoyl-tripeptide--D-alanyl-D-alanine ligase [Palleronia sp. LCG004]WOI55327.1 UDP-N-acetylmuramoyl-tripeptide--D-alanyl-D-alanine ligase [Palleronia sp. LCG004]
MNDPLWTSQDASAATGGTSTGTWSAHGISIDTRTIAPGDLFVALTDQRDGHDFVAQALERGAAAAMVSRVPDGLGNAPLLLVDDVLKALERLGTAGRARSGAKVIAVTGSVGKTTTKDMLRAGLAGQGRVHAAEASYNNHWGVPLTLARMPAETDFAVIEIGMNHPGEIAPLARLARPHVALITTIAPAHLGAFDGLAAIAREKVAIVEGLVPGGMAILPADLPAEALAVVDGIADRIASQRFGTAASAEWRVEDLRQSASGALVMSAITPGATAHVSLEGAGRHLASNALGALAAMVAAGADLALSAQGLGTWQPASGRGRREWIILDDGQERGLTLIDDAYNANPVSVAAALDVLIAARPEGQGRRIAFLGDMLELGAEEVALHAAIARHPGIEAIDVIHCAGPLSSATYEALAETQRGLWSETADGLTDTLRDLVRADDIVLVKGSKGAKTARIVDAIRRMDHRSRQDA